MTDLLDIFSGPSIARTLDSARWDRVLRDARRCELLPRLSHIVRDQETLPEGVQRQLRSGRVTGDSFERQLNWQLERLGIDLRDVTWPVILLKGAAYLKANLPIARGRRVSDVDILVERVRLDETESILRRCGWEFLKADEYDDAYYRKWMHEIPPLRHPRYGTVLDVHHTILPCTGRLHPDPRRLIDDSVPVGPASDVPRFRVLAPEDLVLHAAAHLFQDGELTGGLRDLLDIDGLLRHFSQADALFPERVVRRGEELDLARPFHYAMRYCRQLLKSPAVPASQDQERTSPGWSVRIMDWLVGKSLVPPDHDGTSITESIAQQILYIRSHWLRMPPTLLLWHLTQKSARRWHKSRRGRR